MVLTDKAKAELLCAVVDFLEKNGLGKAAAAVAAEAHVDVEGVKSAAGLLEKKWSSVLRLQKKVMQLEEENKQLRENMSSSAVNKGNKVSALPIAPAAHVLKGHRGGIVCVAFHPLFPLLATASEDATVKTFDSEEGKFERTLKGHTNSVNCVAFSATGNLLVSGSSDLSLKLWSTETWDCVKTMQGHDHVVSDVKFASGDTLILSCSRDQSIRVWDASTGYCTKTLRGHSEWVRSLSVSMKGLVVSAGHDRTVRCWNLATGATVHELFGHEHVIEAVVWAPPASNPWIEDVENAKDLAEKQTEQKYFASASRDKTIRLWDATSGANVATLKGHENWVRALAFHPSGKLLFSVGDDYSVRVWELGAKRLIKTIDNAHEHFVSSLAFSHLGGGMIATADVEGVAKLWALK